MVGYDYRKISTANVIVIFKNFEQILCLCQFVRWSFAKESDIISMESRGRETATDSTGNKNWQQINDSRKKKKNTLQIDLRTQMLKMM